MENTKSRYVLTLSPQRPPCQTVVVRPCLIESCPIFDFSYLYLFITPPNTSLFLYPFPPPLLSNDIHPFPRPFGMSETLCTGERVQAKLLGARSIPMVRFCQVWQLYRFVWEQDLLLLSWPFSTLLLTIIDVSICCTYHLTASHTFVLLLTLAFPLIGFIFDGTSPLADIQAPVRGFKVLHMSPLFLRPDAHVKVMTLMNHHHNSQYRRYDSITLMITIL